MTEQIDKLLRERILSMRKSMLDMLLKRLEVSSDADPNDVIKDFSTKLSEVISDYVFGSFTDYDQVITEYLYESLTDNEEFMKNYVNSVYRIKGDSVSFKKHIYSLKDNHIFQRIDTDIVESSEDINDLEAYKLMEKLLPKKATYSKNDRYPDRPLQENKLFTDSFTSAGISTISKDGITYGDIKNFIPIIVSALKMVRKLLDEYDTILGVNRKADGSADIANPKENSILYRIKSIEDKIGDEDTEGTILKKISDLMKSVSEMSTSINSLSSDISGLSSSISGINSSISSLEGRVSALENAGGTDNE